MWFLNLIFNMSTNIAVLFLLAIGLALVFATRGIINLAHGEFVMLGAYVTTQLNTHRIPLFVAIAIAALCIGLFGLVVERLLIRWLYARIADCMLATWGLSLILVQVVTIAYGTSPKGIPIPFGTFGIGRYTQSAYSGFLIGVALLVLVGVFLFMRRTSFGLQARATAHQPFMAEAVGINTARIDMITFSLGAATAGLAGGLLAPYLGISPAMGQNFIAEVFMSVIVGGANFLVGTPMAVVLLGGTNSTLSTIFSPVSGQVGLLMLAIIIVRIRPAGLTKARVRR